MYTHIHTYTHAPLRLVRPSFDDSPAGELRTPLVSCVLFLADGRAPTDGPAAAPAAAAVGGPTLVLDQRVLVEEDEEEERGGMVAQPASADVG
jgi:hypothetical protein